MKRDSRFILSIVPVAGCIGGDLAGLFTQSPISGRLRRHHRLGIRRHRLDVFFARLPGGLLKQAGRLLDDARLCVDLKPGSARWPSGVATERVLFRRRNVAARAIGQTDVERQWQRTGRLEFEAGQRVNLAWDRRDAETADADRLQRHFLHRVFVYPNCLLGVHLGAVAGPLAIHLFKHVASPLEASSVRGAPEIYRPRLGHTQRHFLRVLELGQALGHHIYQLAGVILHRPGAALVAAVIAPPRVAACALRHDANERLVARSQPLGQALREQPGVIGRHAGMAAKIMH